MRKLFFLLLFSVVFLSGCSVNKNVINNLDVENFAKLIEKDDVFLLDVRMPEETHIMGTDDTIAFDKLMENVDRLPKDKNQPIAVYCRSGVRSAKASETLKKMGYSNIYNLLGGKNAWDLEENKITIFKPASCGCCVGWTAEVKNKKFNVETKITQNMEPIKQKYGIPRNMWSCHTASVGDYFIEGHVPIEAVNKLLKEKPDIKGIALPNMPAGSPGMPGVKSGPFRVYSILDDGSSEIFMEV
ncbi:MAG: hypothetical protein CMH62_01010 [Nanoarchaeota archaeon]|nr:hypothetical protein [Nanoarchaeota archaeon]|tara:strand:+ start:48 stop:776 length:729 start_codon:yes stop_codon:yes gene_type:complete